MLFANSDHTLVRQSLPPDRGINCRTDSCDAILTPDEIRLTQSLPPATALDCLDPHGCQTEALSTLTSALQKPLVRP